MKKLLILAIALSGSLLAQITNPGLPGGCTSSGNGQLDCSPNINNVDIFSSKRSTDTLPTGNFIHFQNHAANTDLFKVDVTGNVSAAGALSVNAATNPCGTSSPCIGGAEGATEPTPSAGNDFIHFNSSNHCIEVSENGSAMECMPLLLGDTTGFNVSTTKHGYAPKLPNDATKYLDGTGAYSVPAGGATINATNNVIPKRQSATAFTNSSLTDDGTTLTTSDNLAFSASFPTIGGVTNGHIVFSFGGVNRVSVRDDSITFQPETDNQVDLGTSGARWKNGYFAGPVKLDGNLAFLTSNYTNATTTFSNVTGLAFPVLASTNYKIRCDLDYQTSAATADVKIQWTGPASPTVVTYDMVTEVTGSTLSAAVATAFSTSLSEAGTPTTTTNFPLTLTMTLINGANAGTVQLQAAATGTGTITIIPGSCVLQ